MIHLPSNSPEPKRILFHAKRKKCPQILGLLIILLSLPSLLGCAAGSNEALQKMTTRWQIENEKLALSLGEKTFRASKIEILKAILTGFPTKNVSILNMDKDIGYLSGEGSGIVSPEKEREIFDKIVLPEAQKEASFVPWRYVPGNYKLRININIFEKKKDVLVKMRFSATVTQSVPGQSIYHSIHPATFREHYRVLWEALDKHLFMQKESS